MKKIALVATLLFIIQPTFSQENFLNGYIITIKGDTIQGLIIAIGKEIQAPYPSKKT